MDPVQINLKNCLVAVAVIQLVLFLKSMKQYKHVQKRDVKYLSGETLDYSGQYRIVRFYKSEGIIDDYLFHDVTIATQCSINHLHHLVELVERWGGPVSCAVFAPNQDASYADDAIAVLRRCFPGIKKHVTFHIVYPASHLGDLGQVGGWLRLTCAQILFKLENYGYQNYDVAGISFPHNVLRNAARSGVLTQHVLLVDIDVMPNVGLRSQFLEFAERKSLFKKGGGDQTAYVLPVFEVKKGFPFPRNKNQLLQGVEDGTVRPFHNETCWWCHKTENFDEWRKIQQTEKLDVAFAAEWDKSWEPFYIAHRSVPMFDERFKQYGFDRIQQICEMHVAGYDFVVLDNAFLTHHGWKMSGKFYAKKDLDNAQNWILFNYHFKDTLQKKYGTNRTCSPIDSWKPGSRKGALIGGKSVINNRLTNHRLSEDGL
ncbi:unnamed protein product [Clavelina lepadiformis]|uniref:Beta-1,4-glucuronyltransferase 1 n=1 Tax=Clavelina lepadiformis TaxID=159417 RepID=A0ABP0FJ06_CLALP